MNFINWLQSIEGMVVTAISFLGSTTIGLNIFTSLKNIGLKKDLAETNKLSKKLSEQNKQLSEDNQTKEVELKKMDLQRLEEQETTRLILKGLTYVISAAGGIDDVTKVAFITDVNKAQEALKEKAEEIKEMTIEKVEEKTKEILNGATDKGIELIEDGAEKITKIIDKYSKSR